MNPQTQIVADMARRGALVSPLVVLVGFLGWGAHGAYSALLALGLVLVNFVASAAVIRKSAELQPSFILMFVVGGFAVRMLFVVGAITLAGHLSWVSKVPLGLAVIVTHLGLITWESRHISASLAYPGLKPRRGDA